jgi:hypothetical protein
MRARSAAALRQAYFIHAVSLLARTVIGANCYGPMGGGYDAIVTTP